MGEFVFPETIKMIGQWGEGDGGGGGEKKGMVMDKKEKTGKTVPSKLMINHSLKNSPTATFQQTCL